MTVNQLYVIFRRAQTKVANGKISLHDSLFTRQHFQECDPEYK